MNDLAHLAESPDQTPGRVLVVDDLPGNRRVLSGTLEHYGFSVLTAASGEEALSALDERPDVVLLDVVMPGLGGYEVCRRIKDHPDTRLLPVVLISALHSVDDRVRGLEAGADDFISKPFNPIELRARVRSLVRLKRNTDDLDSAESVILSLGLTIEARDPTTNGHCQRLATLGGALGARLGFSHDDLVAIGQGGFLHDVGKIGVPDSVLLKPGPLTRNEFELVKRHPVIGDALCAGLRSLNRVRPIIRSHHERLDGSGYPDGLRGDGVPLVAQIIGIVDVFDALTTARPYKPAMPVDQACAVLTHEATRGWRRTDLVTEFLDLIEKGTARVALPIEVHANG